MSQLRCSTFVAMTLTVLEQFCSNSAGRMLSGRGTSSRDKESNRKDASQMRSMQMLVNTDFQQENQKDHKNGRSAKYVHAGKIPAKCPGKPTAQFKSITSNSSSKLDQCIPAPKYWDLPQVLPPSRNSTRIYQH